MKRNVGWIVCLGVIGCEGEVALEGAWSGPCTFEDSLNARGEVVDVRFTVRESLVSATEEIDIEIPGIQDKDGVAIGPFSETILNQTVSGRAFSYENATVASGIRSITSGRQQETLITGLIQMHDQKPLAAGDPIRAITNCEFEATKE